MPLNRLGKKIEHKFEKEYGKEKGKNVFYAWEHKHPFVKEKAEIKKFDTKKRRY